MSTNDLLTLGPTIGFSPNALDNVKSMRYATPTAVAATAACSGYGMSNSRIVGSPDNQIAFNPAQNSGVANGSLQYKVGRYIDTNNQDNAMTTIVNATQMGIEYRTYHVRSGLYMITYDYVVIKVGHLFENINKIGLVKHLDTSVRILVNTVTVNVTMTQPNTTELNYSLTTANNTFSNTCPLMINWLGNTVANGDVPVTVDDIVAGLYINKPPTTTFNGINLALSAAQHPLPNCLLYYSQIPVDNTVVQHMTPKM